MPNAFGVIGKMDMLVFPDWTGAVLAFVCATGLSVLLSRPGAWMAVQDIPNERSLHSRPIPRGGGIAILAAVYAGAGALIGLANFPATEVVVLCAGSLGIGIVSYLDDRGGVAVGFRLGTHCLGAALLLTASISPVAGLAAGLARIWPFLGSGDSAVLIWGLTIVLFLAAVWMINLFNLMV
jgi:UDP-N-acetylmuramyl pentapeptide phosphotransferase/UDP-N-acetylglucosamine-1-phosphate transferase